MKNLAASILWIVLYNFSTMALHSQTASTVGHAPDPDSGMTGRVTGIYIPLITGQPFHARVQVQITKQLPDGTTVAEKYYTLVARDGSGHVHHENRDLIPADSDLEPPLLRTIIYDPKTSLITTCNPERRVCQQTHFDPTSHPADEPVGPSSDGKSVLTRESLGKKMMDGMEVEGTRETRTFKPDTFGNNKPVVVTKEYWYSPQLQINLETTRVDPRNGTQKLEVAGLKLGEPGPEWFTVPDGYRVVVERTMVNTNRGQLTLEKMIQNQISGFTPEQLTEALKPVEAAMKVYADAHVAAAPNDPENKPLNNGPYAMAAESTPDDTTPSRFIQNLRLRLSSQIMMMQQNHTAMGREQLQNADFRLGQAYRSVLDSPCLTKPIPGDPPSFPVSGEKLHAEQQAWLQLRDAWTAFLVKLFPDNDHADFAFMLTNQRASEMQRYENVERNRGCQPVETIETYIDRFVSGQNEEQLAAALKPVDEAIDVYAKTHATVSPNDENQQFARQIRQRLAADLRMMQRNHLPTRDEFEEADLHLNQAYRAIIESPCLNKHIPGDPADLPVNEQSLRAEERAWIKMRDAWTTFLATLFPAGDHAGFGFTLTNERVYELQRLQTVEQNRGCH